MVRIRLMRVGAKGAPSYRVVVADARSPRDGRIIENIGWYNPLTEPSTIQIDGDRAKYWIGVGAQPSDSVRSLLSRAGILPKQAYTPQPEKATAAAAAKAEKVELAATAESEE
jgi:small subunit ribosomal protein S16